MTIGERLREERERTGLNQADFAAIGGASKRSQIDWEKGVAAPNATFLSAVAAHGVDVTYVITGVRMDEVSRQHLTRMLEFSVRKGGDDLVKLAEEAFGAQAELIRQSRLFTAWNECSAEDREVLLRMAEGLAGSKKSG